MRDAVPPEKKERLKTCWDYAKDAGPDEARLHVELEKYYERLPVFELYDLAVAAPLVGKSQNGLKQFLYNHKDKFPPRYREYRRSTLMQKVRVLTAREILEIRTYTLKGPGRFTQ